MENNEQDKKLLLAVYEANDSGRYSVQIAKGSNVAETAFAMNVIIRCFVKEGIIKEGKEVIDLVNKYLTDSQFDEVKEKENDKRTTKQNSRKKN